MKFENIKSEPTSVLLTEFFKGAGEPELANWATPEQAVELFIELARRIDQVDYHTHSEFSRYGAIR